MISAIDKMGKFAAHHRCNVKAPFYLLEIKLNTLCINFISWYNLIFFRLFFYMFFLPPNQKTFVPQSVPPCRQQDVLDGIVSRLICSIVIFLRELISVSAAANLLHADKHFKTFQKTNTEHFHFNALETCPRCEATRPARPLPHKRIIITIVCCGKEWKYFPLAWGANQFKTCQGCSLSSPCFF